MFQFVILCGDSTQARVLLSVKASSQQIDSEQRFAKERLLTSHLDLARLSKIRSHPRLIRAAVRTAVSQSPDLVESSGDVDTTQGGNVFTYTPSDTADVSRSTMSRNTSASVPAHSLSTNSTVGLSNTDASTISKKSSDAETVTSSSGNNKLVTNLMSSVTSKSQTIDAKGTTEEQTSDKVNRI